MTRLSISQRIAKGETVVGSFHDFIDPNLIEYVGHCGYDFVILEHEHGVRDLSTIQELIRAADTVGMEAWVRVDRQDYALMERLLDAGAGGLMVAHVNTADDAREVVAHCKYPPDGRRGEGLNRRRGLWTMEGRNDEFRRRMNDEVMILVILEEKQAIDNVDAILDVPGVNGVCPGTGDLSLSQGLGSVASVHPIVQEQVDRVYAAARRRPGMGMLTFLFDNPDRAPDAVAAGMNLLVVGHDAVIIPAMYRNLLTRTAKHLEAAGAKRAASRDG